MAPSVVVVCGMYSSASTWVFNAIGGLLHLTPNTRRRVGFLTRLHENAPLPDVPAGTTLLIKTHGGGDPAGFLIHHPQARCIVTIRDPRDAVVSLMQRFGYDFGYALENVAYSAPGIAAVAGRPDILLLRYEDGFMDDPGTMDAIAGHLDFHPRDGDTGTVFQALRPDAVRVAIALAERQGHLPRGLPPGRSEDPRTLWHPGHVGDRQVGKYARHLDRDQQLAVVGRLARYMALLGYPA